jgi:hypothetical protein
VFDEQAAYDVASFACGVFLAGGLMALRPMVLRRFLKRQKNTSARLTV